MAEMPILTGDFMCISEVDHEKYTDVKQKYRFEKVDYFKQWFYHDDCSTVSFWNYNSFNVKHNRHCSNYTFISETVKLKENRMQDNHQLLSDFLEELKVQNNGSNLNKYISIFYNDWSLNPYDEDDYSERVSIETTKLRNLNSEKFKLYRVEWCDLSVCDPNFVEICVRKI